MTTWKPSVVPNGNGKGFPTTTILENEDGTMFACSLCDYTSPKASSVFSHRTSHFRKSSPKPITTPREPSGSTWGLPPELGIEELWDEVAAANSRNTKQRLAEITASLVEVQEQITQDDFKLIRAELATGAMNDLKEEVSQWKARALKAEAQLSKLRELIGS